MKWQIWHLLVGERGIMDYQQLPYKSQPETVFIPEGISANCPIDEWFEALDNGDFDPEYARLLLKPPEVQYSYHAGGISHIFVGGNEDEESDE